MESNFHRPHPRFVEVPLIVSHPRSQRKPSSDRIVVIGRAQASAFVGLQGSVHLHHGLKTCSSLFSPDLADDTFSLRPNFGEFTNGVGTGECQFTFFFNFLHPLFVLGFIRFILAFAPPTPQSPKAL